MHANGISQGEMATLAGIQQPHMCNILRKRRSPSLKLALKLSRLTNVALENIIAGMPDYEEVAS
jgi:DNA-binding XRE family transcriptional regulator